jgi:hypothetical protein
VESQQRPHAERNRDYPACPRSARSAQWTKVQVTSTNELLQCTAWVESGLLAVLGRVGVGSYCRGMTQDSDRPADVDNAPDPDSPQFLSEQNTAEKVSPSTSADAPATDAALIPTDPTLSGGE